VDRRWAVNASPVILLAKIGQVILLDELTDELAIPRGVVEEIENGPADDPGRIWIRGPGMRHIVDPDPPLAVVDAWDLGTGENQVLSWAYRHSGFEAVVDDRAARTCAVALGIPVRGTLGVIVLAKKEGKIPQAAPLFEALRDSGIRINETVRNLALGLAGE
jgi:predicted nucleic acid-binding protein